MNKVKIIFSQPVKLNSEPAMKEVIVDGDGHNTLERNVQYVLCNAMSDMKYRGLKYFKVKVLD
tara:strand:+ start:5175 stop:5363 length:189 start_codon:yes stop_codon:yes gene_type:complete